MNYETLREDLKTLSIPEIEQLRDDYQRAHPKEGKCVYLCNEVIKDKQEKESTADFERMLKDALAKKNAPDARSAKSVWRWIFKQSWLPVRGRDMNAGRRYLTLSRWPPLLPIYRTIT